LKVDLLSLILPKSSSFELRENHHNRTTAEDINHILGTSKLNRKEYNLLLMKYIDDNSSRSSLFDELFDETCEIFLKKEMPKEQGLIRKFLNTAIVESVVERCFVCNGTGVIRTTSSIEDCVHCNKGMFVYDDQVRSHMMKISKKVFLKYKKQYNQIIEKINQIEISALSKIGDT